ncbi:MAG: PIN domain-containing protein [Trueperaceae bacterium]|nr:PIN domain-containing protein [Trueperaceae bacterium]
MIRGPVVLDASALMAFLQGEVDDDEVPLAGAVLNSVNFAEVVRRSVAQGAETETLLDELLLLGLEVAPFTPDEGAAAGRLAERAGGAALPFGARACLASAEVRGGTAVTTNRAWANLDLGVPVRVVGMGD